MANLQVRDIDDRLYESIRMLAKSDKRSISQEVVHILEKYLSRPESSGRNPTDEFLKLSGSWEDERSADEIISEIRESRRNSSRFEKNNEIFD
ncbi:MAG: antitoxin [Candidatus Fermentibacteria bacterium]|nr:antitoxin [Candidatus Fermentibacteria bacterium]